MEQQAQIKINGILSRAQAVKLSKPEVKQLDSDKPNPTTEQDYYDCAYYICQQRNAKSAGFYSQINNVLKLAENDGITIQVETVPDKEVILPFFAGGI